MHCSRKSLSRNIQRSRRFSLRKQWQRLFHFAALEHDAERAAFGRTVAARGVYCLVELNVAAKSNRQLKLIIDRGAASSAGASRDLPGNVRNGRERVVVRAVFQSERYFLCVGEVRRGWKVDEQFNAGHAAGVDGGEINRT